MGKRKRSPSTAGRQAVEIGSVTESKKQSKTTPKRKTKPRARTTELVPMDADVATLIPKQKRDSLVAWFELYMGTEAGPPESNTFKAKKRDLQRFVNFLQAASGTDHPDQWTKSVTESFLRQLAKRDGLAATSVNRVLATIKHVASWIHLKRSFLVGNPCERVRSLDVDEPEWGGLSDLAVNRLRSAAEQLCYIGTRSTQQPLRDRAIFLALLHTAL